MTARDPPVRVASIDESETEAAATAMIARMVVLLSDASLETVSMRLSDGLGTVSLTGLPVTAIRKPHKFPSGQRRTV